LKRVLVLYATVDGQTRRLAERVAGQLARDGIEAVVGNANAAECTSDLEKFDGVIVGAGIRYGDYPKYVAPLVRERIAPRSIPGAFFSVCLSAGGPGARPKTAQRYVDKFLERSRWRPAQVASFGGALLYTRYNPVIRFLMRMIVGFAGGHTDMSRDYEYTDWAAVDRFAADFGQRLGPLGQWTRPPQGR